MRPGIFRHRYRMLLSATTVVVLVSVTAAVAQKQSGKAQAAHQPPPYWAYAVNPPADASTGDAKPADDSPQHVPGSDATFTLSRIGDLYAVPDWHPNSHPTMPLVVAHGRKPEVYACGYCHLPNGQGRPENSSLAGLPMDYMVQQMADFKSGQRKCSAR